MANRMLLLKALLLAALSVGRGAAVQCVGDGGKEVDWWLAIKGPDGSNYSYYDPTIASFSPSPHSMNDTTVGALASTLQQLWKGSPQGYVLYNDEVPDETSYSYTYGHTKGLFGWGTDASGYWLSHSIPAFPVGPQNSSKYLGLPDSAYTYAQNLLCLSVSADTLDSLAYKFLLNRPHIYNALFPSPLAAKYPNISSLVERHYSTTALCAAADLQTTGGQSFQIYAKTKAWNQDLWASCVAPDLASDLWVESWIRGSAEGPECPTSGFDTLDVQGVAFSTTFAWKETNDHSKWGVAVNRSTFCFGDINRMTTQYARGGGTACIMNPYISGVLQKAVTGLDSCSSKNI